MSLTPTILIAESEGFAPEALRQLSARADVVSADLDRQGLLAAVANADVLWVRLRNQIDEEVFAAAPRLSAVVTNTTGVDHIDLDAARRRGIQVISLRGELELLKTIRATAELTLGLLLALTRRLPAAAAHVRGGGWNRYEFKGHDLYEKTAGLVGFGRLGRIVAGYFRALGMKVLATTIDADRVEPAEGVAFVPLEELLAGADVVSVHVDLNPGTRCLFGDREFTAMREGAWFVNTARGEIVDEPALLRALESGKLSGAAVDVVTDERSGAMASHPLLRYAATHDHLIVTPHIGGYTFESLARTELHLTDILLRFLDHRAPVTSARL